MNTTSNQNPHRFQNASGEEVWIGVVQVEPTERTEIIDHNEGAYVPVLALGRTKNDYIKEIIEFAEYYHLVVIEVDDIETFVDHMSRRNVKPEYIKKAEEVLATGYTRNGIFACYLLEEGSE